MATLTRTNEAITGQEVYDSSASGSSGDLSAPGNFDTLKIHTVVPKLSVVTNLAFAFTFADIDSWVKAAIEGSLDGTNFVSLMGDIEAVYETDGTYHIIWTRLGAFPWMRGVFVSELASPSSASCNLIVRAG